MRSNHGILSRRTWGVVVGCSLAGLIPEVSGSVLNQAWDRMVVEFNVPVSAGPLIISASKLLLASLVLTGGTLGDLYGHRRLLIAGTVGMGVAGVLSAASTSAGMMLIARALDGVFSALVTPLALASLVACFKKQNQTLAIGFYLSILGAGSLFIPYLSAFLIESFSWHSVLLVSSVIALMATAAVVMFLPRDAQAPTTRRPDVVGAALAAAGLLGVVFAIIGSNQHEWIQSRIWGSLLGGILLLVLFVRWEHRRPDAMLDLSLFGSKLFSVAVVVGMVVPFVGAGLSLPFLYYFRGVWMEPPSTAALRVMPIALATSVMSPIAGKLAGVRTPREILTAGLLMMGLGALGLSLLQEDSKYFALLIPMLLTGAGSGLASTQRTGIILSFAREDQAGAASGVNTVSGKVGSVLGTAIMSTVFLRFFRSDYGERMQVTGLSIEQLRTFTLEWRRVVSEHGSLDSLTLPRDLLPRMEAAFPAAFCQSLGSAELLAAILLFLCAALAWRALK